MIRHTFTPSTRSNGHNLTPHFQNNHITLQWASDQYPRKHRPGDGWRKLTQECIRRLVLQGAPVDARLQRWAGVDDAAAR